MKKIKITKMNGSGNDFIIIDNRFNFLKGIYLPGFARILCRRESVGADGLILVEHSKIADFKWRFFNSDGSEAEMCGNGGRCVARFAYLKGISGAKVCFETIAGIIHARVKDNRVKLQLPQPTNLNLNQKLVVDKKTYLLSTINTGAPHAVLQVRDLEQAPVIELGKKIRFHQKFQPAGTNVNFIKVINSGLMSIRTYERGVEGETLACGTGSIASALIAASLNKVTSPVKVSTRSGELLTIYFKKENDNSFSQVFLEGDTCLVFEGILGADVWEQVGKLSD